MYPANRNRDAASLWTIVVVVIKATYVMGTLFFENVPCAGCLIVTLGMNRESTAEAHSDVKVGDVSDTAEVR
jgi:hypothetical protein